jgi:WD40 repeat protein
MESGEHQNRPPSVQGDSPAIDLECPKCDNKASISAEYVGYTAHCRRCGETFKVRSSSGEAAAGAFIQRPHAEDSGGEFTKEPQAQLPTETPPLSMPKAAGKEAKSPGPPLPEKIGRFHIRARLGAGAFGTVYRAYDPQLDREVALKVPQAGTLDTPKRVERFLGDAKAAARLRHPHIVPVYDAGFDGTHYYIASAFVEGRTLAEAMEGNDLTLRHSVQIVRGLAEALAYAHLLGIVHRDVKPANVMLDEKGQPHLIDFGLAHRRDSLDKEPSNLAERGPDFQPELGQRLTQDGAILGTPAYMPPEQAIGRTREVYPASDQYSLGAMLYELLCGQTPFSGPLKILLFNVIHTDPPAPSGVKRGIPRDLEVICLKALAKRPKHRFTDCQQLADDLRRWLEGEPILARRPGRMERIVRWCRREPKLAGAVGVAALAVVAVALLAVGFAFHQSRNAANLRQQQKLTETAREKAEAEERQAKRLLANSLLDRGQALCERGEIGQGMVVLAYSLEIATAVDDADLQRTIRMNLSAWRRPLHPLRAILNHPDNVIAGGFTPDGQLVLTFSKDGTRQYWNPAPIGAPDKPHASTIRAVAFSADRRKVCVIPNEIGFSGQLYDTATGEPLGKPLNLPGLVHVVALSADGQMIFTGVDKIGRLFDVTTRRAIGKPLEHDYPILAAAFSPDGKTIVTGSGNRQTGEARLWEVQPGLLKGKPIRHRDHYAVHAVAFSPDGKMILTGAGSLTRGEARLWDAETGEPIGEPLSHHAEVYAVAFSPDGETILTGSQDRSAQLWDTRSRMPLGQPLRHLRDVRAVAFSPDGRLVLTGGDDQTARLWEVAPGLPLRKFLLQPGLVLAAAFSPDEKLILTGSASVIRGEARRYLAATGELVGQHLWHDQRVTAVAFSPNNQTMLTAAGNLVQFWDLVSGELVGKLFKHESPVLTAAFSPDGKTIVTGCEDGRGYIWDAKTGNLLTQIQHRNKIYAVAFSPDGTMILTSSSDKTARLWNAVTGAQIGESLEHPDAVLSVVFGPGGKNIVTGYVGGAQLWERNADKWEHAGAPFDHAAGIFSVACCPDGRMILTGGTDRTARLWDALTKKQIGPSLPHEGLVSTVRFSRDGRTILTASHDGTSRLWETPLSMEEDLDRMVLWTRVITGMNLDQAGVVKRLDSESWVDCRRQITSLKGLPGIESQMAAETRDLPAETRRLVFQPRSDTVQPKSAKPVAVNWSWLRSWPVAKLVSLDSITRYLPNDTGIVACVNVRQILVSPLVWKQGLWKVGMAIKDKSEFQQFFTAAQLDPFLDINDIVLTASIHDFLPNGRTSGVPDKGLAIIHGRFKPDKIHAAAADFAKKNPGRVKTHRRQGMTIYEVVDRDPRFFVAVFDDETILLSPSEDYLLNAIFGGNVETEVKQNVKALIENVDLKQSAWLAWIPSQELRKKLSQEVALFLGQIENITGVVSVGEGIKFAFTILTKDEMTATRLKELLDWLNEQISRNEQNPHLGLLKNIQISLDGKAVIISGSVDDAFMAELPALLRGI